MFERYTEKARRVIFFARYEASQLGGGYIETEHILLGALRENKVIHAYLPPDGISEIRARIGAHSARDPKLATSVDLPLSEESKRVLTYAAEEAAQLGHKYIGSEHLFLGLLREDGSYAAQILRGYGIELAKVRTDLADSVPAQSMPQGEGEVVVIHESKFPATYVQLLAAKLKKFLWQERRWHPADVVMRLEDGLLSFDLSLAADQSRFELKKRYWWDDRCSICRWQFSESAELERSLGFSNGRDWLCLECHRRFVSKP